MLSFCLPVLLVSFLISSIPQSSANPVSKVEALNEDWNVYLRTFDLRNSKDAQNVVIDEDKKLVYVGAVNYLYALNLDNVNNVEKTMPWSPDEESAKMCGYYMSQELCNNMIRVLHSVNDTHLYACGTYARDPRCIYVNKNTFQQEGSYIAGSSKSPADPYSVAVSSMTGDSLFTAINPTDQYSQDKNMIAKSPADRVDGVLTTNEMDNFWLSDPHFVSMFTVPERDSREEKVFVLFKENAEEIPPEILTQDSDYSVNVVYSRLATICANDRGGSEWFSLDKQLATFSKMRIACPVSFETSSKSRSMPFFYDEIQSTYVIPNPQEPDNPSLYAIFKTQKGMLEATATCVYQMKDIRKYMDTYKYWNKPRSDANVPLFSMYMDMNVPAPGSCAGDTRQFSKDRADFGSDHPLKFGMIKPKDGFAIYHESDATYSHIVVDRIQRKEKITGVTNEVVEKLYDVVHYITETGFIKRIVFSVEDRSIHWEIPPRQLYDDSDVKHKVLTVKKGDNGFIYFGTAASVIQLQIASCSAYKTCGDCRISNDPYCEWDDDLDIACKAVNFSTKIMKNPLPLYGHPNETGCRVTESGEHKKQSPEEISATMEELQEENEALIQHSEELNHTISRLENEKKKIQMDKDFSNKMLYTLYRNYTHLQGVYQYTRQKYKTATKLYRDTTAALNECRQENNVRKALVKSANVQLKVHRNATAKCKKEKRAAEQAPCNCRETNQIPTSGPLTKRLSRQPESTATNTESSSCQRRIDMLRGHVKASLLRETEMKEQIRALNRSIDELKNENAKLVVSVAGKKECVGRDQWIPYRPTNKLFLISLSSVSFETAKRDCANLNATVADLKDNDEAEFVFNITHMIYQRKRFWVGMRKYIDGIRWLDGSNYDPSVTKRFPKSQRGRVNSRIEYCVETLHRVRQWQLIPCNRHRRVVCVKGDNAGVR